MGCSSDKEKKKDTEVAQDPDVTTDSTDTTGSKQRPSVIRRNKKQEATNNIRSSAVEAVKEAIAAQKQSTGPVAEKRWKSALDKKLQELGKSKDNRLLSILSDFGWIGTESTRRPAYGFKSSQVNLDDLLSKLEDLQPEGTKLTRSSVKEAVKEAITGQKQGEEEKKWRSALEIKLRELTKSQDTRLLSLLSDFGWNGMKFKTLPNLNDLLSKLEDLQPSSSESQPISSQTISAGMSSTTSASSMASGKSKKEDSPQKCSTAQSSPDAQQAADPERNTTGAQQAGELKPQRDKLQGNPEITTTGPTQDAQQVVDEEGPSTLKSITFVQDTEPTKPQGYINIVADAQGSLKNTGGQDAITKKLKEENGEAVKQPDQSSLPPGAPGFCAKCCVSDHEKTVVNLEPIAEDSVSPVRQSPQARAYKRLWGTITGFEPLQAPSTSV